VLPFLPEPEQCQGQGEGDRCVQYPFVVQEQGTKLGIPIFCWVPVLDAAYGVFKDAVKTLSSSSSLEIPNRESIEWWQDPGTAWFFPFNQHMLVCSYLFKFFFSFGKHLLFI
jgi:hypothetical protein